MCGSRQGCPPCAEPPAGDRCRPTWLGWSRESGPAAATASPPTTHQRWGRQLSRHARHRRQQPQCPPQPAAVALLSPSPRLIQCPEGRPRRVSMPRLVGSIVQHAVLDNLWQLQHCLTWTCYSLLLRLPYLVAAIFVHHAQLNLSRQKHDC